MVEMYLYDASGRMVQRRTDVGYAETYLYDGAQMIAALDETASVVWEATWGASIDYLLSWSQPGSDYVVLRDERNSVAGLWDTSAKRLRGRMTYDANGRVTALDDDLQVPVCRDGGMPNFEGTWSHTYSGYAGAIRLRQRGDWVWGDYGDKGIIEGRVDLNTGVLDARFTSGSSEGRVRFELIGERFEGLWGWGTAEPTWNWDGDRTNAGVPTLREWPPSDPTFEGTWQSTYQQLRLRQAGTQVWGDYGNAGTIKGVVDLRTGVLEGTFNNQSNEGRVRFTLNGDSFSGLWAFGTAEPTNTWNGWSRVSGEPPLYQYRQPELSSDDVCIPLQGAFPFAFNTAWRSPVTGLSYMRNRWYSAELGQFLSTDPLGHVDSFNMYSFGAFDPINRWDPWGLKNREFVKQCIAVGMCDVKRPPSEEGIRIIRKKFGNKVGDAHRKMTEARRTAERLKNSHIPKAKVNRRRPLSPEVDSLMIQGWLYGMAENLMPGAAAGHGEANGIQPEYKPLDNKYAEAGRKGGNGFTIIIGILLGARSAEQLSRPKSKSAPRPKPKSKKRPCEGCFVGDTPVQMCDGSKRPIESVQIGDLVQSKDEITNKVGCNVVDDVHIDHASDLYELSIQNEFGEVDVVVATGSHPFLVPGTVQIRVENLAVGTFVLGLEGQQYQLIGKVLRRKEAVVYNLAIRRHHTYFVGTVGVWVHNCFDPAGKLRIPGVESVRKQGYVTSLKIRTNMVVRGVTKQIWDRAIERMKQSTNPDEVVALITIVAERAMANKNLALEVMDVLQNGANVRTSWEAKTLIQAGMTMGEATAFMKSGIQTVNWLKKDARNAMAESFKEWKARDDAGYELNGQFWTSEYD